MLRLRRPRDTSTLAAALLVAAAVAVPAACSGASPAASPPASPGAVGTSPATMSADEIAALIAAPPGLLVVLDVRTPEEFAGGHLAGAVPMDVQGGSFTANATLLDHSLHYVVYCQTGNRSAEAVRALDSLGFEHLYELDGGITAWQAAGHPVVRD